jgi:hypothetical protein
VALSLGKTGRRVPWMYWNWNQISGPKPWYRVLPVSEGLKLRGPKGVFILRALKASAIRFLSALPARSAARARLFTMV